MTSILLNAGMYQFMVLEDVEVGEVLAAGQTLVLPDPRVSPDVTVQAS